MNLLSSKDDLNVRIMQMSAGVDMSMAVTTKGDVYGWGKADHGRIGVGLENSNVHAPTKVSIRDGEQTIKAVDVDCGYNQSIVVGLNGTVHVCGGVDDMDNGNESEGLPRQINDFNIWHRVPEPRETAKEEHIMRHSVGRVELTLGKK